MISIQDFISKAYNKGCHTFDVSIHITPHGVTKINFVGKDSDISVDGIVHNDSICIIEQTLEENVRDF